MAHPTKVAAGRSSASWIRRSTRTSALKNPPFSEDSVGEEGFGESGGVGLSTSCMPPGPDVVIAMIGIAGPRFYCGARAKALRPLAVSPIPGAHRQFTPYFFP